MLFRPPPPPPPPPSLSLAWWRAQLLSGHVEDYGSLVPRATQFAALFLVSLVAFVMMQLPRSKEYGRKRGASKDTAPASVQMYGAACRSVSEAKTITDDLPCGLKHCPCSYGSQCIMAKAEKPRNVRCASGRRISARAYETLLKRHKAKFPHVYVLPRDAAVSAAKEAAEGAWQQSERHVRALAHPPPAAAADAEDDVGRTERRERRRQARRAARKQAARVKAEARAEAQAASAAVAAEAERARVLQVAEEEARRLLESAQAKADALQSEAKAKAQTQAAAARSELAAEVSASRRATAELMQGQSNVARKLLTEELMILDEEAREEREEREAERKAAEAAVEQRAREASAMLREAAAQMEQARAAQREAARVLREAQAQARTQAQTLARAKEQEEARTRAALSLAEDGYDHDDEEDVDDDEEEEEMNDDEEDAALDAALEVQETLEASLRPKAAKRISLG